MARVLAVLLLVLSTLPARAESISSGTPTDLSIAHVTDIPSACPSIPLADTLNGAASSQFCYTPYNATRPTVVQAASVTTDSSGNWSVTWSKAFATATYFVNPQPAYTGTPTQPYICNVNMSTQTTSFVQGKCWQTATTAISILGITVNPTTNAASGVAVRVAARDATQ